MGQSEAVADLYEILLAGWYHSVPVSIMLHRQELEGS